MSVRLKRQQPSTEIPTRRDFLALQDSIQLAIDQLEAQPVEREDIATWAVGGDEVQPNIVTGDHLEPFLLSACKYIVATDQNVDSDVPIEFGTRIYDGEGVVVASKFKPVKSGVYRCNALIRIEDNGTGFVQHGQNARVVLYDETAGAPVLLGAECPCITDIKGDVINAVLDETFEAIADHEYTVRHQIPYQYTTGTVTVIHHIGYHAGEVKTSQTFVNGDGSINIDASFVEFQPIAQPE